MEDSHRGKTDLVVFCNGGSQALKNVDRAQSEGRYTFTYVIGFARYEFG